MRRFFLQIRSALFRSGLKRAEWYRKKGIFGASGADVMIQDWRLPYDPKAVCIGSSIIIGAGSVVTKDLPDNSVCAGVPRRKIGEFDGFVRKRLNESKELEDSK